MIGTGRRLNTVVIIPGGKDSAMDINTVAQNTILQTVSMPISDQTRFILITEIKSILIVYVLLELSPAKTNN